MYGLRPIVRLFQLAYYRRALKEMGASHPDAPYVLLRIAAIEREQSIELPRPPRRKRVFDSISTAVCVDAGDCGGGGE